MEKKGIIKGSFLITLSSLYWMTTKGKFRSGGSRIFQTEGCQPQKRILGGGQLIIYLEIFSWRLHENEIN